MALLEEVPVKAKPNKLPEALGKLDVDALSEHITTRSLDLYHDQPKAWQVEAVSLLVQGKFTFVRARTGYGKTRISGMFFGMFDQCVVVLVLAPLNSLWDDQSYESPLSLKISYHPTSGCKWVGFGSENLARTRPEVHAGSGQI
ncbi:hypothetical protein PSTG_01917 [Puccinia striiformis f. sp. tritici PST-78]|uniref:DEAD/DEAH box helicase domain-containing protein n=1 Tax=Puccinia striiformis f. sp. tritici PST-78 TaxID=1165861 RepID=A0A0L0W022_9BASI|nr:hypothetical protein PSTG_01917 [Puccinia striiformis f. sp. tritici PST-78]